MRKRKGTAAGKKVLAPEPPLFKFPKPDFAGGEERDAWIARARADFDFKVNAYIATVRAWQEEHAAPKTAAAEGEFEPGGGSSGGGGATGGW